jgi:predicted nucleotidyltransferase
MMSEHSTVRNENHDPNDHIEKLLEKIKTQDVDKVILFGSSRNDPIEKRSDLGLIVVQKTDKPFLERLDEWYTYLRPGTAIDILVYTPEEIDDLRSWNSFLKTALTEGKVLFEAA